MFKKRAFQLVCFLMVLASCLSQTSSGPAPNLLTVAVLTMPAPEVLRQNYYREGEEFTFVPGSTVDFIGLAGSMPVLVPFDIDEEKLKFLLDKSDSVVLASSDSDLTDELAQTTPYMKAIAIVMDYAVKRNTNGKYFPVLAIGNGMDALIKYYSESATTLKCDKKTDNTTKMLYPEGLNLDVSLDWKTFFHDNDNQVVLKSGSLYFDNKCHTEVNDFNKDKKLSSNLYYMASSSEDAKKYAEMVIHQIHPFIGVHFHAEKHIYERGHHTKCLIAQNKPSTSLKGSFSISEN